MPSNLFKKCTILAAILGTLSFPILAAADMASFTDVDSTNRYTPYIQNLKQQGIIDGNEDGSFAPHDVINRAEFIKMVVVGFQLSLDHGHFHFSDLNWAAPYIQTAWNHGIIQGTEEYKFSPDAPIKREEAAAIIWRLLQFKGVKSTMANFNLANTVDAWAAEGVTQCLINNLFGIPFPSGTFLDALSREEAAAMIDASLKFAEQEASSDSNNQAEGDLYENTQYGFSLTLPASWKNKYVVTDREIQPGQHNLEFVNKATKSGVLFTISVWSESFWSTNEKDMTSNTHVTKIGERGTNVFLFHTPTDVQYNPNDAKLKADYESMFSDVESIQSSFKIIY